MTRARGTHRCTALPDRENISTRLLSVPDGVPVRLRDRADHPAGVAYGDGVIRDILHDDAPAADHHIAADRNAGHHLHAADPHIVADGDGVGVFEPLVAALSVDGVPRRIKAAVRRDKHVIPKPDFGSVENDEIMVGIKILAELDVVAIVAPERRGDGKALAGLAESCRRISCCPCLSDGERRLNRWHSSLAASRSLARASS